MKKETVFLIFLLFFCLNFSPSSAEEEEEFFKCDFSEDEEARIMYEEGLEAAQAGEFLDSCAAFSTASKLVNYRNKTYEIARNQCLGPAREQSKQIPENYHLLKLLCAGEILDVTWYHGEPWLHIFERSGMLERGCGFGFHPLFDLEMEMGKPTHEGGKALPWIRAIRHMPEALKAEYTLNGSVPVEDHFIDDAGHDVQSLKKKSSDDIWTMMEQVKKREKGGCPYNTIFDIYRVLDKHLENGKDGKDSNDKVVSLKDKRVLVVGSLAPWMESVAVVYGAKEIVSVDYISQNYGHPLVKHMSVADFDSQFSAGLIPPFDVAVSISSLEHDGLGRYGDPLDPFADVKSMAKLKQFVREGGLVFFSVPIGPDLLYWNAHRRYGPIRLPLLLEGFEVVEGIHDVSVTRVDEPLFVLRNPKKEGGDGGNNSNSSKEKGTAWDLY